MKKQRKHYTPVEKVAILRRPSAAVASGFLLACLSKMPRLYVPDGRKLFCPRHFRSSQATIREFIGSDLARSPVST